jgi:hypothetical protein
MKVRPAIALLAFLLLAAPLAAHAQQNTTPEPIVRTAIEPQRVMVGQSTTLRVEVLAPNYMTSPPDLAGFQLRNAVTRQLQSVNTNEQQNGIEYAGVRFEFAIYPLEPGAYAVPGQKLTIKYAAEPPATREAVISLPPIEFQAFIPDAAASVRPFVTADRLTAEQTIQRSSEALKVGDAVTRIVTVKATGTPAMLLPPATFHAIDGLAVYPAQPSLQDKTEGRSDVMLSSRVDSVTYMSEAAGNYVLPAIDISWWNAADGRIERTHLDAVTLQVAANPLAVPSTRASAARFNWNAIVDFVADQWLLALIILAAIALLTWFAPRVLKALFAILRQRREAWLQSESFFFNRLRHAARRGDARAAYFALLDWLQRFEPAAPLHSIEALKTATSDRALTQEIDALETHLFAPRGRSASAYSLRRFLRHLSGARRTLQRSPRGEGAHALPQRLNPIRDPVPSHHQWRAPAR